MSRRKKKMRKLRAFFGGLILLAVICAAVVFIVNGGSFDLSQLKIKLAGESEVSEFNVGSSASAAFGRMEGGIARVSTSDIGFIDGSGNEVVQESAIFDDPSITCGGGIAVAYDMGGTRLVVFDADSVLLNTEAEGTILDVTVNDSGYIAVSVQESSSKGLVTIYNSKAEAVFRWYSNEGYLLSAEVSPDSKYMAAVTITDSGTRAVCYSLSSVDLQWEYIMNGQVPYSIRYLDSGGVCIICDQECIITDSSGELTGSWDYGGLYLRGFDDGSKSLTVFMLSSYQVGNQYTIVSLNSAGEVCGQLETDAQITSLSSCGEYFSILYTDSLSVYNINAELFMEFEDISGGKEVLTGDDGTAVVIFGHTAVLYGENKEEQ